MGEKGYVYVLTNPSFREDWLLRSDWTEVIITAF